MSQVAVSSEMFDSVDTGKMEGATAEKHTSASVSVRQEVSSKEKQLMSGQQQSILAAVGRKVANVGLEEASGDNTRLPSAGKQLVIYQKPALTRQSLRQKLKEPEKSVFEKAVTLKNQHQSLKAADGIKGEIYATMNEAFWDDASKVNMYDGLSLIQPFTEQEILDALYSSAGEKTPGPDGYMSGLGPFLDGQGQITNLHYADDTIILCKAEPSIIQTVKWTFVAFEALTGLWPVAIREQVKSLLEDKLPEQLEGADQRIYTLWRAPGEDNMPFMMRRDAGTTTSSDGAQLFQELQGTDEVVINQLDTFEEIGGDWCDGWALGSATLMIGSI